MTTADEVKDELKKYARSDKADFLPRFFKTGKGEYGEGDIFLGVVVPDQRKVSIKFKNLEMSEIKKLLSSKIHEERLTALLILDLQYNKASFLEKTKIAKFYISNSMMINNWDLVDLSAPNILGDYLLNTDKNILYQYAKSVNLWKRRIAIISTLKFIKNDKFDDTFEIAKILLNDKHDLIHKAVGWMLREVGKRDIDKEEKFLKTYYTKMPRTMLRYAIELFPEEKRKKYLLGSI